MQLLQTVVQELDAGPGMQGYQGQIPIKEEL